MQSPLMAEIALTTPEKTLSELFGARALAWFAPNSRINAGKFAARGTRRIPRARAISRSSSTTNEQCFLKSTGMVFSSI